MTKSSSLFQSLLIVSACALISARTISGNGTITIDGKVKFTLSPSEKTLGRVIEKTVDYYDANGKLVARDFTRYDSSTLEIIEGALNNYTTGGAENIIRSKRGTYRLEYKKNSSSATESEEISEKSIALKGSLTPEFINRNYDAIANGNAPEFRMLVPSRLESIGFKLQNEGLETLGDKQCRKISLLPTSWIIRQFAGTITFWVETNASHKVAQYEGRIPLADAKGNMLSGKITYP